MKKKYLLAGAISAVLVVVSCDKNEKKAEPVKEAEVVETKIEAPVYNTEDPSSMLTAVAFAQGSWNDLYDKKDVEYTYDYRQADGKADISTERYIFATETSYGVYTQHDINAMPGIEGSVAQYFDGKNTLAFNNNEKVEDPAAIGGANFLRQANYFWFVMPYKLNDEGTILKYMGKEAYNDITYDKLEVTYDASITGKEQNDIYILYINPSTKMIDRFFFSLPALGVNVPVIIANYEYEEIEGQKIATKRTYFMPNEEGGYGDTPNIVQTLTDIKFNNGFTNETIMK